MQLVATASFAEPIAKVRIHPTLNRFVSFSGSRDVAFLSGWEANRHEPIARFGSEQPFGSKYTMRLGHREVEQSDSGFCGDVAFHPGETWMAIGGRGRPVSIQRVSDGSEVASLGDVSQPLHLVWPVNDGIPCELPPERQGFSPLTFTPAGDKLFASIFYEPGTRFEGRTYAYDLETRQKVGSFFACHRCLANHPDGSLIATLFNDQGGACLRFIDPEGPFQDRSPAGPPRIRVSDQQEDRGWIEAFPDVNLTGMTFSPDGGALAVIGGYVGDRNSDMCVLAFEFDSLSLRFEASIAMSYSVPREWLSWLSWLPIERVAFHPDGRSLLVPQATGHVVALDAFSGAELGRWKAHDHLITTIDMREDPPMLITGSLDGFVKVWSIEKSG